MTKNFSYPPSSSKIKKGAWQLGGKNKYIGVVTSIALSSGLLLLVTSPASASPVTENFKTFSDVPSEMMFSQEMSWLANQGISTGWADGTYRPLQNINRDAMAAFLYRLAGSPEYSAPTASPFRDVTTNQKFYKEMSWLYEKGISTGWDEGDGTRTYRPLIPINRDAMAAFLFRFSGDLSFEAPQVSPFSDIKSSMQFYKEISWLSSKEIATGWDNGEDSASYRPLAPIKRDAMAAYLFRLSLPPESGGVVLSPETIILDATSDVLNYTVGGTAVTINSTFNGAPDIDPGDVLVAGFSDTTPDGMLVRVGDVITNDNGTQIAQIKTASLPDAIYNTGGLQTLQTEVLSQEFIPADGVELVENPQNSKGAPNDDSKTLKGDITSSDADVRSLSETNVAGGIEVPIFEKSLRFSEILTSATSGKAWKTVDVQGSGSITFDNEFGMNSSVAAELEIRLGSLKEAEFTLNSVLFSETVARASGQLTGTAERNLGTVNTMAHVQVGPVPVAVQMISSIDLNAKSEWQMETLVRSEASIETSAGMRYRDGSFESIFTNNGDGETVFKGPELTSESVVSVGPTLTAKLYGIAGLTGGVDAYASYVTGPQKCEHEVGIEGRAGVIAGIEVLGFKLTGEWKKEKTDKVVFWEGNLCEPINTPPIDQVTEDVFGDGIKVTEDGGAGDATQWGRAANYGPGGAAWILSTGRMQDSIGPSSNFASTSLGTPGNEILSSFIDGAVTYDAASYWANITPEGETLYVRYFFASEEYPEYVGSDFNDVMGIFVNGKNCATVPGTKIPISVNNVNATTNSQYYIDNSIDQAGFNSAMDGMTTSLTCSVPVTPGVPLRIEIAIADTGDMSYDSAVALTDRGIWSE